MIHFSGGSARGSGMGCSTASRSDAPIETWAGTGLGASADDGVRALGTPLPRWGAIGMGVEQFSKPGS